MLCSECVTVHGVLCYVFTLWCSSVLCVVLVCFAIQMQVAVLQCLMCCVVVCICVMFQCFFMSCVVLYSLAFPKQGIHCCCHYFVHPRCCDRMHHKQEVTIQCQHAILHWEHQPPIKTAQPHHSLLNTFPHQIYVYMKFGPGWTSVRFGGHNGRPSANSMQETYMSL